MLENDERGLERRDEKGRMFEWQRSQGNSSTVAQATVDTKIRIVEELYVDRV